jgi:hypothetical protein
LYYLYIYKTRLASNEIFSPSNKIHREVGRAKDLSALRYSGKPSNVVEEFVASLYVITSNTETLRFKM